MTPDPQVLEQGAQWAGQHALPLFAATLAVTLGQCWRMLGGVAAVAGNCG